MNDSVFGWHYPAGAEHDPRAPWNQDEDEIACWGCGKPAEDEQVGDICEDCDEPFKIVEPDEDEPCRCGDKCYC